jgi:hypothetical protein
VQLLVVSRPGPLIRFRHLHIRGRETSAAAPCCAYVPLCILAS